jgi:hypothetical protein
MATKKEREEEERKARLLALVNAGGAQFREAHIEPPRADGVQEVAEIQPPSVVKQAQPATTIHPPSGRGAEEPVLGPEPKDPANYLVKRRKSLRDDREWVGTTLYLRRETHAALQEFCRGAGLDMSRVVQYCVSIQMDEKQRSPVLAQLLA